MEAKKMKTVFVTGSSRGIGKAIASYFGAEGYNVIINCSSHKDELIATEKALSAYSNNVMAILGDMSDYTVAQKTMQKIINNFDSIDVLVNNAGVSYVGLFNTMQPKQWISLTDSNLNSVFNCTHCALQYMIPRQSGCIINISSMWGSVGASCEAVYSATKGAVNAFTKALAKEVAPCNIRVNAIACGAIDTSMNSFMSEEEKKSFCEEIPLGKFGSVNDIAETALFLAGEGSKYITGQIIGVDGGMT